MPETNLPAITDLVATFGGPAAAGGALTWAANWLVQRRKNSAEAEKMEADAEAILAKVMNERLAIIMTEVHEERKRLRTDINRLWNYVEVLRGELRKAGVQVPPAPEF